MQSINIKWCPFICNLNINKQKLIVKKLAEITCDKVIAIFITVKTVL